MRSERTLNEHEYIKTSSENETTKIWGISSNWESLITKGQSVKAASQSLTVHRLRDSTGTANYLRECGQNISYADIELLNTDWVNWVTKNYFHNLPVQSFRKKKQYIYLLIILIEDKTLTGA